MRSLFFVIASPVQKLDDDNRVVHLVWRHLTDENSI